jgi:hypothetical protein
VAGHELNTNTSNERESGEGGRERERAVHENFPERWNSHHMNESILDLKKISRNVIRGGREGEEREEKRILKQNTLTSGFVLHSCPIEGNCALLETTI